MKKQDDINRAIAKGYCLEQPSVFYHIMINQRANMADTGREWESIPVWHYKLQ